MQNGKWTKGLVIGIIILFVGAGLVPNMFTIIVKADHNWTIDDDYSFPKVGDYDYGISSQDLVFDNDDPSVGDTITITADIHNYGLCLVSSPYGWYSPDGRSCWIEWDFSYPITDTIDISYRCYDDVTVDWRVELDGNHLASPSVPGVGSNNYWKIVTIEDVNITAGSHTLFLGTYEMDFYPDYRLDWVKIGDLKIEAETYDRMGGFDPEPDWCGVIIYPRDITVQIWQGDPLSDGVLLYEDFVGDTNTVKDFNHLYPENSYTAQYIENNGTGKISCEYTIKSFWDEIYVVIDPDNFLNETDESNNMVSKPCPYNIPFMPFWMKLLERFPHLFPILRELIGY